MRLITGREGVAHITSADQRAFNNGVVAGGDVLDDQIIYELMYSGGDNLDIVKVSNTKVRIKSGDGIAQGLHFRIPYGTTEDLTLSAGTAGYYRRDLIAFHYQKAGGTGVETAEFVVIEGTPAAADGDAALPTVAASNIYQGATEAYMSFAKVHFSGTTLDSVEKTNVEPVYNTAKLTDVVQTVRPTVNTHTAKISSLETKTTQLSYPTPLYHVARDGYTGPNNASRISTDLLVDEYIHAGNYVADGHYFYPKVGGSWAGGQMGDLVEEMAAVINQIMYINSVVYVSEAPALTLYDNNTSKGGLTPEYQTTFRWKVMNLQIASYYFKFVSHGSNNDLVGATISTVLALRGFDFKILGATGDITFAGSRTPLYLTPGGSNQNYLFFRHGGTGASITGTVATDDYIRIVVFGVV